MARLPISATAELLIVNPFNYATGYFVRSGYVACDVPYQMHFWTTVCKTVRPIRAYPIEPLSTSLSVLSVRDVDVLWPNGSMDYDATWYGGRICPRRHCATWGPNSHIKGRTAAPTIRPMSIVAKQLDGSVCHLVRRKVSAPGTLC